MSALTGLNDVFNNIPHDHNVKAVVGKSRLLDIANVYAGIEFASCSFCGVWAHIKANAMKKWFGNLEKETVSSSRIEELTAFHISPDEIQSSPKPSVSEK